MVTRSPGSVITSRDNALVKDIRRLAQDNTAYRKQGQIWLEGDHLCRALLGRGQLPSVVVASESFHARSDQFHALYTDVVRSGTVRTVVLADKLFADISGLESPAAMGYVVALPLTPVLDPLAATVVLDRVQDAGNVGSILRSAAAFGFKQVVALKGSAALWSPKVLRAGMGAHFGLRLIEGMDALDLDAMSPPLVVTSSHQGQYLHQQSPPYPCTFVMGHEGQGVSEQLIRKAAFHVRIAQPGGEESLNVAAAAAICLHATAAGR